MEGSAKCTPFEINILAARAVQATGNGQTALNDLFFFHHGDIPQGPSQQDIPGAPKAEAEACCYTGC